MDINEYQCWTDSTAVYPEATCRSEKELNYLIQGFTGESGELANLFKKWLRDETVTLLPYFALSRLPNDKKDQLIKELGDALWYMARIARVLGYSMTEVAQLNHDKLEERKAANQLKDHSCASSTAASPAP